MKSKKSTGELLHEIATTKQDFESFANENKDEFDEFDSRDYLNRLLNMKNLAYGYYQAEWFGTLLCVSYFKW